jgi:hypothetical protein
MRAWIRRWLLGVVLALPFTALVAVAATDNGTLTVGWANFGPCGRLAYGRSWLLPESHGLLFTDRTDGGKDRKGRLRCLQNWLSRCCVFQRVRFFIQPRQRLVDFRNL